MAPAAASQRLRVLAGHVAPSEQSGLGPRGCQAREPKRVAVIGTGISGTAALKACLEQGLEVVCFEKQEDIGGFWRYKEELEFPSVYNATHIDSKRDHNSFGTVPATRSQPQVMNHRDVIEYLRRNHRECDLTRHVRFNTEVTWITDAREDQASGLKRWRVEYTDAEGQHAEVFDGVMICSGRHSRARLPRFEGMESFRGFQIHTNRYKDAKTHGLEGKRVVVVGVGNSGNDMVNENGPLCEHLWWVARRGTWIVEAKGEPSKYLSEDRLLGSLQLRLPWQLTTRMIEQAGFRNQALLNEAGLRPDHHFLSAHPSACGTARGSPLERGADGHPVRRDVPTIHDHVRAGKVTGKRGIRRLTETSVIFSDGEEVEVDAIIYATGFKQAVEFLDPEIVDMTYEREDAEVADKLYQYAWPMQEGCGSIAFIAFCQSITFMCSELQSRLFAAVLDGQARLPSLEAQRAEMLAFDAELKSQFTSSPRHAIQGATRMAYYDRLAELHGSYPSLWRLLTQRPSALWHALFTPWTALTYRLVGPGSSAAALRAIEEQVQSTREALGTGRRTKTWGSAPRFWPGREYWSQVLQTSLALAKLRLSGFDPESLPRPDYLAPEHVYEARDLATKEANRGVLGSRDEQLAGAATIAPERPRHEPLSSSGLAPSLASSKL